MNAERPLRLGGSAEPGLRARPGGFLFFAGMDAWQRYWNNFSPQAN
jgi:hypothetical protein